MNLPPAQQKAVDEARALLKLNVESYILTFRCSDESGSYSVETFWEGTMPEAVGLAEIAVLRMQEIAILKTDFTPFDDREEA